MDEKLFRSGMHLNNGKASLVKVSRNAFRPSNGRKAFRSGNAYKPIEMLLQHFPEKNLSKKILVSRCNRDMQLPEHK